jgi:uncharacterized oxidoreductase
MKTVNNTVLITGGSAGIGLQIARLFAGNGNTVIITGRNRERLDLATSLLPNATGIVSDVSSGEEAQQLVDRMRLEFPSLNLVVNNAGNAFLYDLASSNNIFEMAAGEMLTNYLSVIRLNQALLPLLRQQAEAAIVNVSSIVAFVPGSLPTYSASKAALHSYTQSLRLALQETPVKVFELMPPLVDTGFSAAIGGSRGIKPKAVAEHLLRALEHNEYEIRVGQTEDLYRLYLSSPEKALEYLRSDRKPVLN